MAKLIHTMVRVLELERSISFYSEAFGLEEANRYEFDGFTLLYLSNDEADHELELTLNHGQQEPYGHDDGYGHIAFRVEDVESEHGRFVEAGFAPRDVKEITYEGETLGKFFFAEDPDGYQIEVLERRGRF